MLSLSLTSLTHTHTHSVFHPLQTLILHSGAMCYIDGGLFQRSNTVFTFGAFCHGQPRLGCQPWSPNHGQSPIPRVAFLRRRRLLISLTIIGIRPQTVLLPRLPIKPASHLELINPQLLLLHELINTSWGHEVHPKQYKFLFTTVDDYRRVQKHRKTIQHSTSCDVCAI